jgi:low temperature requirement protein LtrA
MSGLAEQESRVPPLLRDRSGVQRVTNIELFFDLVYVFAVTQLSHYLIGHSTVTGALQTGLLLAMVWLVWAYTTWVTNWLDPELMAVRLLLVVLMLVSLAMSASLPRAFEDLGLWVGGAYALQQIGRWRPTSSASWPGAWSAARSPWAAAWPTATRGSCCGSARSASTCSAG